jgi:hypothetical protein
MNAAGTRKTIETIMLVLIIFDSLYVNATVRRIDADIGKRLVATEQISAIQLILNLKQKLN